MKMIYKNSTIQKSKKKIIFLIILIILCLILTTKVCKVVMGDDGSSVDAINSSISNILDNLDLSALDGIIAKIDSENIFGMTVKEKINLILSGEYFTDYSSIFSVVFSILFVNIKSFLPLVFTILAIGLLSTMVANLRNEVNETNNIVYFLCFSLVVLVSIVAFRDVLSETKRVISSISSQMQILFPILISLLVSIGSLSSVSIYNPLVAVLTTVIDLVFDKLLYPIFILILLFTILGNLTDTIKLGKLTNFFSSSFKWIVGIVFTLFSGFLSIQGITAGKFDSVSIKATKFAVKSYIPIIGSYVSEGMDYIVLGSVLLKNSIGLIAVFILFLTIISPIIKLIVFKLFLQLTSGILEMSGSDKISNFVSQLSKILVLPIVLILGVAFMYIITIALIICTANIF